MLYPRIALVVCSILFVVTADGGEAVVRETTLEIPTYAIGPEDVNPPLWKQNVYPYPMQTRVSTTKSTKPYRAVILENDFIRVIILPDVGGRIYAAHDKTNDDFDFIYHNHVVKPGLVALRGAWLSGGIEWNFPTRGHTTNTVSPVQYKIIEGKDGSVTCVVGTIEWVRRMKWSVATTIWPDRSDFRNRVLLFNPTLTHNNGYFWANAAVHAWSDTRVTFPPTDYTYFRSRHDPQAWPINQSTDVSWYKNTPTPFDYFSGVPADYVAAYNHDRDHGTVHFASRHDSFGKKFWTWGTARSGLMWEDVLTDSDGQYIELQSGRLLTQGDAWIFEPHLQETWDEYWYPVKLMKGFVKANRHAAVNLEVRDGKLVLGLNTTREFQNATLEVLADGRPIANLTLSLPTAGAWHKAMPVSEKKAVYQLIFRDSQGRTIISYSTEKKKAPPPELEPSVPDIKSCSVEEIYLAGYYALKHWQPERAIELFNKALEKDPGFTPALRGLAMIYYKTGRFQKAYDLAKRVLLRNDDDYTARYYRALAKIGLSLNERTDEDLNLIGRRAAYRHVAPYLQAAMAIKRGDIARAEQRLHRAIRQNPDDLKARAMLVAVLRRLGRKDEALKRLADLLRRDPLNCQAAIELALLKPDDDSLVGDSLVGDSLVVLRDDPQYYLETACDYMAMNLPDDAVATLELYLRRAEAKEHPMICFYLGYLADRSGKRDRAKSHFTLGTRLSPDYVFPFRTESLAVLKTGLGYLPDNWKLHYYLGTLLTAKFQWKEGLKHLLAAERSAPDYPVLYRNIGEVYWNKLHDLKRAQAAYEKAIAQGPNDYTYYVALDQIYGELGDQAKRADLFAKAPSAVKNDFHVALRQAIYNVDVGRYADALEILKTHTFHPWEGWTEARETYVRALHLRADELMKERQFDRAIADIRAIMKWPENLGAGQPHNPDYVSEYFKLGLCHKAMGNKDLAREFFKKAVESPKVEPKPTLVSPEPTPDWHKRAVEELERFK